MKINSRLALNILFVRAGNHEIDRIFPMAFQDWCHGQDNDTFKDAVEMYLMGKEL